jgi:hypothetical protein
VLKVKEYLRTFEGKI